MGCFLFLLFLAGYMYITYVWAKQGGSTAIEGEQVDNSELTSLGKCWLMIVGSLILIVVSARIPVPSAAEIGHRIGVPEDVISATMVALGTSLPELMTAIAAIRKVHPEITIVNIVGANVLNCLFVIGAAAAARSLSILPNFYSFHFPAMVIILYSFRYFIFRNRDGYFKRTQGAWLLGVYLVYLILQYVLNIGTVGR
jgi:cation:H+ antiporter